MKLTLRQRKWLAHYIETGCAADAARLAGYSGDNQQLAEIGYQNTRKLQMEIGELMGAMGLDDGALLHRLREGLSATVVEIAKHEGAITDERVYVDFNARAKYLDIALRLGGKYPVNQVQGDTVAALVVLREALGIDGAKNGE